MVNPNPGFLSKRVKKIDQSGITSDRYEFLGLDQAEPDLGDPIIGVSSVGANPFTGNVADLYFVASNGSGKRYWTKQTDVIAGGTVTPGSITVRDEGVVVGSVNQITDINFVGSGVTVKNPATWVGAGSSSVDIQIVVTDVVGAGNSGNIQFRGTNGLLQGTNDLSYNTSTQRVGIGTNLPTEKLEVIGNAKVNDLTAQNISASSFTVSNFVVNQQTLTFVVTTESVGIGTTIPTATLDVRGNTNVSGVLTASRLSTSQLNTTNINATGVSTLTTVNITGQSNLVNVNVSGTTTSNNLISTSINVSGVGTITTFNSTTGSIGTLTGNNLNYTGISTLTNVRSSTINNTGVTTTSTLNVGTAGTIITTTGIGSVGIGSTIPRSRLDVAGDIRLSGAIYDVNNSSGSIGQVLLSNGSSPVTWGSPGSIVAGSATSVTTVAGSSNTSYYITFVPQTSGSQSINLDTDSLTYNPSTNTLTVDNISAKILTVDGLSRNTTGIVTTSSKNEIVIDNLDTTTFRTAKYLIQVNTSGQLTLDSGGSVSGLNSGRNYFPGTYSNVSLTNVVGSGTDARAIVTVSPEATLPIVGSLNGTFTTSGSTVGIATSQSLIFTQSVLPSAYENSRVTNISLSNAGSGYTSVPTFTFTSPIISGNPIEGVGVGSTATGIVNTMKVSNIIFNNVGFVTTIVPTVTIKSPGAGTTATANVAFGVSTITVTVGGIGYLSIPSVLFSSGSATAGVSTVIVNRLRVTDPGYGYTTGDLGRSVVFNSGAAAAITTSFSLPNSNLGFTITSPGAGYTVPPTLTVASPQIGINTGTVACTLGITTFTVTQAGSGYTVSPTISNSPTVSEFIGTVGLGVSDFAILLTGGNNYTGQPTITFSPVGGIGTGASATVNFTPNGPITKLNIINPGYGYTVPPTVTINGGGGAGAAATIRTMVVANVTVSNIGFGATAVVSSTLSTNPIEFLDNPFSVTGTVGIATTSRVDNVIFSSQGTLSVASTTIISGISTFNTIILQRTGDLDAINDTTITGIDTSGVSVGFAVTGTFVQAGTAVSFVSSASGGTIGLTTNLTNPSVGFGLTFFIADTLSQRVIVGQGVSGPNINLTGSGTTVVSIGNSSVTLSQATSNTGVQTSTFFFGTLTTIPGTFQTTLITGITTSGISTGQRVTSTLTQENTNVVSIGIGSITIDKTTTNVGVATTSFTFFTVTSAAGAGASITPSMGIGRVTVGISTNNPLNLGFGTGYTALPGIAVTAADGITGGGGIVTTSSFGIDTDCFRITNPGIYTSVPLVLINPPGVGGGSATIANVGVGLSTIIVTSPGSYTVTKPTISFSGGNPLVSADATVNDIILNGVSVVNAGSGYTTGDITVTTTFSNVSLGATVGLTVENISLTSAGLGYTTTPTITFTAPTLSGGIRATATAVLANYGPEFSLSPGPGYGGTFVYYVEPVTSNTFRLYRDINRTNQITLGFSTIGNPSALIGGRVSNVSINYAGSGYTSGNILSASAVSIGNTFSANVGTGFSFTAVNIVQNYQISDLLMLQSVGSASTSVDIIEYAGIANLDDLVNFAADISGSNARLKATPKYRDNTIKINRTSITR